MEREKELLIIKRVSQFQQVADQDCDLIPIAVIDRQSTQLIESVQSFPQWTKIYHIKHPFPSKDNSIIGVTFEKQYCGDTHNVRELLLCIKE